ncbi:MAG: DNA-directed RNA polymerase subunit omega [Planctomycetota bacterium]|jgi:DNA-directed RNA polymerase omega subunit
MQYQPVKMINTDKLADIVGGRYALTCLVAKRMIEINAGSPLLVEEEDGERTIDAVCREIEEGKIWLERPGMTESYDVAAQEDIGELLDLD